MFAENRKISCRQMQALLFLQCFGTAILFLPAELAAVSGRGCWITAAIGGGVFALLSVLLSALGKKGIAEQCREVFGLVGGTAVLVGLAGKLLFDGACELRLFSEVACRSMLPNTPVWVLSLVLVLLCVFSAAKGIEAYGRLGELLFFFVALPLVLLLAAVAVSAEYQRLLPATLPSVGGVLAGLPALSIVFQGLPFLYFAFPYVKKRKERAGLLPVALSAVLVTGIVLLSAAVYGESSLAQKLLPTLQMLERVSFTGIFLTRQDVVFLWFWMCAALVFVTGGLLAVPFLLMRLFRQRKEKRKKWLWGTAAVLWGISCLPENLTAVYHLRLAVSPWLQLLYVGILPVVLYLHTLKEQRHQKKRKGGRTDA